MTFRTASPVTRDAAEEALDQTFTRAVIATEDSVVSEEGGLH